MYFFSNDILNTSVLQIAGCCAVRKVRYRQARSQTFLTVVRQILEPKF